MSSRVMRRSAARIVAGMRRGGLAAAALIAVLLVGLAATGVATWGVRGLQRREAVQVVDRRADIARWAAAGEAGRYLGAVEQVAAAVGARPAMTAGEFASLAAPLRSEDLAGAAGIGLVLPAGAGMCGRCRRSSEVWVRAG